MVKAIGGGEKAGGIKERGGSRKDVSRGKGRKKRESGNRNRNRNRNRKEGEGEGKRKRKRERCFWETGCLERKDALVGFY